MSFKAFLILLHQFKIYVSFCCSSCPRTCRHSKQEFLIQRRRNPARNLSGQGLTRLSFQFCGLCSPAGPGALPLQQKPMTGCVQALQTGMGRPSAHLCASSSVYVPAAMLEPQAGIFFHTSKCTDQQNLSSGTSSSSVSSQDSREHCELFQQLHIQVNRDICASCLAGA